MKKKTYIIPTISVYEIKVNHQLLTGSPSYDPTNPSSGDAGGAASPAFFYEDVF